MHEPRTKTASLTVIIATKNEALNIEECISSVQFANEILVLDSGSSDYTVATAKAAGATVHSTDWPGYGLQQLRGIELSSSDWVLSLDADERISPELKDEILHAISHPRGRISIAETFQLLRSIHPRERLGARLHAPSSEKRSCRIYGSFFACTHDGARIPHRPP